jgi:hypothetical protein
MFAFIIGLIFSNVYSYYILPINDGESPSIKLTFYPIMYNSMLIIPYNSQKCIHLHHWLIYLFICLLSIFYKISEIIIGFSFGLFIQGIQYKDSFIFHCNNPYN